MLTREQMIEKAKQLDDYDTLAVDIYSKNPSLAQERLEDEMITFAKTQDPRCLLSTMRQVAQAKGITEVGKATGLTRAAIYSALSGNGNPKLDTLLAILHNLGYTFAFKRIKSDGSIADLEQKRHEEKLASIKVLVDELEDDLNKRADAVYG